jgi:hypothetical protein
MKLWLITITALSAVLGQTKDIQIPETKPNTTPHEEAPKPKPLPPLAVPPSPEEDHSLANKHLTTLLDPNTPSPLLEHKDSILEHKDPKKETAHKE